MSSLKRLFRRLRGVGSDNPIRGQVEEELTGHLDDLQRAQRGGAAPPPVPTA